MAKHTINTLNATMKIQINQNLYKIQSGLSAFLPSKTICTNTETSA